MDSELEVLEFVHDGMSRGAIGVNLGRNIWQNDFPVAMIRAIRYVVHEHGTAKEGSRAVPEPQGRGALIQPHVIHSLPRS